MVMDFTHMRFDSIAVAIEIAKEAHKGQTDLGGTPYIFHPLYVATMVDTKLETVVAILHDVFEDSKIKRSDIENLFSEEVLNTVELLTRKPGVDYFDYIKEICKNKVARKVKLADLEHNMDITRLNSLDEKDFERLKKYHKAYKILVNYEEVKS